MYAYVAFPIANYQQFIYSIPKELEPSIKEGTCIYASFRNKYEYGFIVSLTGNTSFRNKIKSINNIADNNLQLSNELWKTIKWVSKYYMCPLGIVLKTALPLIFKNNYSPKQKIYFLITPKGCQAILNQAITGPKQLEFLELLQSSTKPQSLSFMLSRIKSANQIYKKLKEKNLIEIVLENQLSSDIRHIQNRKITLNKEQSLVFNQIKKTIIAQKYHPFLLNGVTGSGKTEVYIKLAKETIQSGKTVIVLVPEISLTPQLSQKFIDTFGDSVALWHSKLTKRQKYQTWQGLNNGKYSIIIGARSAIFTPIQKLGLIIVDEEHDSSYKQDTSSCKYHARDVSIMRAKYSKATIILGSATPSVESYYYAQHKKLNLLNIKSRYNDAKYPSVKLVDMKEGKNRFSYDFSHELIKAMKRELKLNNQIIILHNRRGFSTICRCEDCGYVALCNHCSISLTYHSNSSLLCHYCSTTYQEITQCKECKGSNFNFIGTGTQKIESEIKKLFTDIKIARMDFDTMNNYNNYQKILDDFSNHKYDVLLGTQMVSKGLDFKGVTLVGVINGDTNLYIPDFRSGERTFQLLYQVCGRAGRNNQSSKAIIQSWNPDNTFIQTASQLDLNKYYKISLTDREELNYPPFSKLIRIVISGHNKESINLNADIIKSKLNCNTQNFDILGPSIAPIEKINNKWRFHLLIKVKPLFFNELYNLIKHNIGFSNFYTNKNITMEIDVDPVSIL